MNIDFAGGRSGESMGLLNTGCGGFLIGEIVAALTMAEVFFREAAVLDIRAERGRDSFLSDE